MVNVITNVTKVSQKMFVFLLIFNNVPNTQMSSGLKFIKQFVKIGGEESQFRLLLLKIRRFNAMLECLNKSPLHHG